MELIILSSLIFSIVAMGLSLARIVRSYREGKRKILALKDSIMESTKLLVELDLGTPIISAIKSRLEQNAEAFRNTPMIY